jgi:hypothetical protein
MSRLMNIGRARNKILVPTPHASFLHPHLEAAYSYWTSQFGFWRACLILTMTSILNNLCSKHFIGESKGPRPCRHRLSTPLTNPFPAPECVKKPHLVISLISTLQCDSPIFRFTALHSRRQSLSSFRRCSFHSSTLLFHVYASGGLQGLQI